MTASSGCVLPRTGRDFVPQPHVDRTAAKRLPHFLGIFLTQVNGDQGAAKRGLPAGEPLRSRRFLGTNQLPQMAQRLRREVIGTPDPLGNADELEVRLAARLPQEPLPGKRFHAPGITAAEIFRDAELHQVVEPLAGKRRDPVLGPFERIVVATMPLQELGHLEKGVRARKIPRLDRDQTVDVSRQGSELFHRVLDPIAIAVEMGPEASGAQCREFLPRGFHQLPIPREAGFAQGALIAW